jgi:hypothetical protein
MADSGVFQDEHPDRRMILNKIRSDSILSRIYGCVRNGISSVNLTNIGNYYHYSNKKIIGDLRPPMMILINTDVSDYLP